MTTPLKLALILQIPGSISSSFLDKITPAKALIYPLAYQKTKNDHRLDW
jgi:hypothetical protein